MGAAGSVDVSLDGGAVADLALAGQSFGTNLITSLRLGETTTGRTYDIAFDDVTVTQTPPSPPAAPVVYHRIFRMARKADAIGSPHRFHRPSARCWEKR